MSEFCVVIELQFHLTMLNCCLLRDCTLAGIPIPPDVFIIPNIPILFEIPISVWIIPDFLLSVLTSLGAVILIRRTNKMLPDRIGRLLCKWSHTPFWIFSFSLRKVWMWRGRREGRRRRGVERERGGGDRQPVDYFTMKRSIRLETKSCRILPLT